MRRIIFWAHLIAGFIIGAFVFIMAATGVLLTYEAQILESYESHTVDAEASGSPVMPLDTLALGARERFPYAGSIALELRPEESTVVKVLQGRRTLGYLDPYTGEDVDIGIDGAKSFFGIVEDVHRWLAQTGDARGPAKSLMGAANLAFLIMILTGAYLWLPKVWQTAMLKRRLWLDTRPNSRKALFWNWHHVFGIWTVIPLVLITSSALVFSYGWASNLVYYAAGDAPPGNARPAAEPAPTLPDGASIMPLSEIAEGLGTQNPGWLKLQLVLPESEVAAQMEATVYVGGWGTPMDRTKFKINRSSGLIEASEPFSQMAPGRRARIFVRYLHTGEAFGIVGQTLFGLASLLAALLVVSGLYLGTGRLYRLVRKRRELSLESG